MSGYVMRVLDVEPEQWLERYDIEAHEGRGAAHLTDDKAKALKFPTMKEAMDAWRTQSKVRPVRDDGKPNRPLTAFTVEIEQGGA